MIASAPRTARETIFTNVRVQLDDREMFGTVVVRNGAIAEISEGRVHAGIDGDGALLMPGLVEVHTDNLERALAPRPGLRWPIDAAVAYHDANLIAAGITTVFDAIAIGDVADGAMGKGSPRVTHHPLMIGAIEAARAAGRLACTHAIHLRCELVYDGLVPIVEEYVRAGRVAMISVMDHTPGQRQFMDLKKFEQYYVGKHGVTPSELHAFVARRVVDHETWSPRNRRAVVELAREFAIPLASHDDATRAHVDEALADGAVIAEFPTTVDAAHYARERGLAVVAGAPNVILGGSHSGNVSALELLASGDATVLSSDYVPQSLLHAIFAVAAATGEPLFRVMRAATVHPARAAGYTDRGAIEIGARADLLVVEGDGILPRLRSVIVAGERVA